jgi:hypothetical protein
MLNDIIKILAIICLANFAVICTVANVLFLTVMFSKPRDYER